MMHCGTFKTRSGAERYVARQAAFSKQVNDTDVTACYKIQPTVGRKAWHLAGSEFVISFKVYYAEEVSA
jgi:hypothetical protein